MIRIASEYDTAWAHSNIFDDTRMLYLYILTRGRPLEDFSSVPEDLIGTRTLIEAQKKASITAKVDLNDLCFFDLVPEHQLARWFSLREEALVNLQAAEKKEDYQILHKAHVLVSEISRQKINFKNTDYRINYDIFGTVTGRLSTKKESFAIMNLKKESREYLKPQNDLFVELDLNAAEVRTLLALSGQDQPSEDIHLWLRKNFFKKSCSREEVKRKVFSWLYNFSAPENELSKIFSREIFRDFYCKEKNTIKTPFGRAIEVEERKAQNYLLQSTTSDIVIENAYKIMKKMKNMKSNVAFTLHDSIILDVAKEEVGIVKEAYEQFRTTPWGPFLSTCKVGKNFLDLREVKV